MLLRNLPIDSCFALYRTPGRQPLLVRQKQGEALLLSAIPTSREMEGFVFAPFGIGPETPLVLLGPGCVVEEWLPPPAAKAPHAPGRLATVGCNAEAFDAYAGVFSRFSELVRSGAVSKLVLSRAANFACPPGFSPEQVFANACAAYPQAFVFLFHTPATGLWLGASPEPLLRGDAGGIWQTTAIAGTRPAGLAEATPWDAKNRKEQAVVADFIDRRLTTLGVRPDIKQPVTCRAGNVAHIRSDFFFSLPATVSAWEVISRLYPTPAICGLPQEKAKDIIMRHEGYDRQYYSGFLGPVGHRTDVYINLRCMRVNGASLRLFAGGGIMPDSSLEQEWNETIQKMDTLLAVLALL